MRAWTVVAAWMVCLHAGAGSIAVDWIPQADAPNVATATCAPEDCSGTVTVVVPTPDYLNSCFGLQAAGGSPEVVVDSVERTIELLFVAPAPVGCPGAIIPVEGLTFEVSGLAQGRWRVFGENPVATFDFEFSNPAALGGNVDWIDGENGPDWWSLDCEDDDCSGVVNFQGPSPQHSNSCFANRTSAGQPVLTVDEATRSVELWFSAPAPQDCIAAFLPVEGLSGSVSGLAAGRWRFFSDANDPPFELQFTVGPDTNEGEVAFQPGTGSLAFWTLDCDDLDCSGSFNFEGPTDTYTNDCFARALPGGDPVLSIDEENRSVELWFAAPNPGACTLQFDPWTSLAGSFGPLDPGTWHFFSREEESSFSIEAAIEYSSVGWDNLSEGPPFILCDTPECDSLFSFQYTTPTFSNACVGETEAGGKPVLAIDYDNREIELFFSAPEPVGCSAVFQPVNALVGTFGPLEPGSWRFYSDPEVLNFELEFDVECPPLTRHSADQNEDGAIQLTELLRVIQFYNAGGVSCATDTEDGFAPGGLEQDCCPHASDFVNGNDWAINLSELLRLIQYFNTGGYEYCPDEDTEDNYCAAEL